MDDMDFSTLAARVTAGLNGVRACLVLSSDGLTLGVYPESGEARAREAWDLLQHIGDPQRGFVDIGEEVWVFVRSGPYAGVLLSGPGVRPGLLFDKLDFLLRAAEEARARESSEVNAPPAKPEATRRPRSSLHGDPKPAAAPRPPAAAPTPAPARPAAPAPEPAAPARASAERSPGYKAPPALSGAAKKVVDVTTELAKPADVPDDAPQTLEIPPGPESLSEAAAKAEAVTEAAPKAPPAPAPARPAPAPAPPAPAPKARARIRRGKEASPAASPPAAPRRRAPAGAPSTASESADAEVDRVALAREFGRLLVEGGAGGDR